MERKPLFRPDVMHQHLVAFPLPESVTAFRPSLTHWADLLGSGRADKLNEKELLPDFLTDFFVGLLGYTRPADGGRRYTLSREKRVQVDGKYADAVLGDFNGLERPVLAVEGKGTRDPLDRPFAGRKMSAVDQCYRYAINLPCDWILVTSMRQVRLYYKGTDQLTYERFDVEALADNENLLRLFVFLLGADRVVPVSGRSHLYELLAESDKVGRELTKKFYIQYGDMRQDAFARLCQDNPQVPPRVVLADTQKLLDRVLFCAFAEDRGLLPVDTIQRAYEHRDPYHPRPIYDNFRGLFQAINGGNAALGIHAYNGGLFAEDASLDHLQVADEVCAYFRDLGGYDYRPPHQAALETGGDRIIDVDILGHIFEQSITDLERLRNELDGLVQPLGPDKHKTRRKKEGAFYTPSFVTRYMVEQALGGVLRERFEHLRQRHQEAARGTARTALADPAVYALDDLKKPERAALVDFWDAWQDVLVAIRVLDLACGSGAFLIQAFDQLYSQYQASNARLTELRGARPLLDLDKRILENNLYGVDLNAEAVEICRLSLWIKTAHRGKPLTSLDHTIRVGNSVVDDPQVHPLAFHWQAAFPEVFQAGGFDVVVGNPPYIRQEWLAAYKSHWEAGFQTYHGVADIFTYFFERSLQVLRDGGRLAFITSGSWVRGNFGGPLRKYLVENATVESMIDFGEFQPFEDAEMIRPTIAVLKKQPAEGQMRIFKWLTTGRPPENLSEVIAAAPTMRTEHLGSEAWELDAEEVLALRRKLSAGWRVLAEYTGGRIFRGIVSGLTDVFVIGPALRNQLVAEHPSSEEILRPFGQGTHLRPWYMEESNEYLVFTRRGIAIDEYPAVLAYLERFQMRLAPKPNDWPAGKAWQGRKPGVYKWYEIQDTIDYWREFNGPKIVWPDISKLPRFSMDTFGRYLGNTAFIIPGEDYYLLGLLNSWATWFFLSKTAQPLRLRGDRWQYRLFAQYMEQVPVPDAREADRRPIAELARRCGEQAAARYELQTKVQRRLVQAFGQDAAGAPLGALNQKAREWWSLSLNELGQALKTSFQLAGNPFKTPRAADEWEPYLAEHGREIDRLTRALADAEGDLNDRVYHLFGLTPEEIQLLQREVAH